jgi:hypothetical protein
MWSVTGVGAVANGRRCCLEASPELSNAASYQLIRAAQRHQFSTLQDGDISMTDPKRNIQGEGDKEADRKYRERTAEFLKSKKGRDEIEHAGNLSEEEAKRLREYEEKGKARARDEDPQIKHQSKR